MESQFRCEFCGTCYGMKQNLARHYRIDHKLQELPDSYKALKERKVQCPDCGIEKSRLDKHVCRMRPQTSPPQNMPAPKRQMRTHGQSAAGSSTGAIPRSSQRDLSGSFGMETRPHLQGASGRASPSDAMNALSVSGANRDQSRPTDIISIVKDFDNFMESLEGGKCQPNTREQYRGKMTSFLKFIANEKGPDTPGEIMAMAWANHGQYEPLPHPSRWIDATYPNERDQLSSKSVGMNAFKKFCDYLLSKLEDNMRFFFNMDEYTRRKEFIEAKRKKAGNLDEAFSKSILVNQKTKAQTNKALGGKEAVPTHVMKKIFDDYQKSAKRQQIYEALRRNMAPMTTGPLASRERIRDWLALELFLAASGCRTDVIRNLKVREVVNAESYKNGNFFIISVEEHKTSKSYAAMEIECPRKLHELLIEFVTMLYPGYFSKNDRFKDADLEAYVFNTNRGTQIDRLQASIDIWRLIVPESFGKWRPTPYDFRHYCATQYQMSNDEEVRRNAPEMIGHSEETERRRYVNKDARNDMRHRIRKTALGTDHLLDPDDDDKDPSFVPTSDHEDNSDDDRPDGAKSLTRGQKFVQQKKEEQKVQREKLAHEQKVASFKTTGRHKVTPDERLYFRQKFDHLGRETLLKNHITDALNDAGFFEIFQAIKQRQNFTNDSDVIRLIQESYKASIRTEKKK